MKTLSIALVLIFVGINQASAERCSSRDVTDCLSVTNYHNDITGSVDRCVRIAKKEVANSYWLWTKAHGLFGQQCEIVHSQVYVNTFATPIRCKGQIWYRCDDKAE